MTEILVGLDDSPGAEDALAFATRLAATTGASLHLASVFPYSDVPSRGSVPAYREMLRSDTQALLDRAAASLDAHVTAAEAIAHMSAPHALHDLAERTGAALVVVGSTRRGPIGRILPGSTGERLLHGSPCPVAIVPRGYADAGPIETIGVGYDGSDESETALVAAYQAAGRLDAGLRVVRIFDATRVGNPALMTLPGYVTAHDDYEAQARDGLDRAIAALAGDVRVTSGFVCGTPGQELAAQSEHVDLMFVGSRGYGPRAAVLLGGTTHTLIRKAACPVVVLPRGSRGLDALFAPAAEAAAS